MGGSLKFNEIEETFENNPEVLLRLKKGDFIETGTYHADTSIEMSEYFKNVYTTEIHYENYCYSLDAIESKNITNINTYYGDSLTCLEQIMPLINEWSVFFLDAHVSGDDSSWNGKQLVPLIEELDIILSYNKNNPALYIIDDTRFFDGTIIPQPSDWEHISPEKIVNVFLKHGAIPKSVNIQNDRMFIIIAS